MNIKEKITTLEDEALLSLLEEENVDLSIDEHGNPVLGISQPSWLKSFFSACAYYCRRLFSSKEAKDNEDSAVAHLTAFLKRIQVQMEIDPNTGSPSISLGLADEPVTYRPILKKSKKCKRGRKPEQDTKKIATKRKKKVKKVRENEDFIIAYDEDPREPKEPEAVEYKHGNIVYHIQNLNVYINAEVVTQLNVNPQKVMNLIQDKVRTEIEQIEKQVTDDSN